MVSLIPHFNRALKQSLEVIRPGTPLVTILTDIADYPPRFWLERQDQWVICGSERALAQAQAAGLPEEKILRSSGMILHPQFYDGSCADRRYERERLGLDPDLPTGLVMFGGEGSLEMVEIARRLNRPDLGAQLILVCGRHEAARRELLALPRRIPMFVEGLTAQMPFYMELSDFFIGKPGPGSISEAAVKQLPIIVRRDWRTLAHERYNCDWILEQDMGVETGPWTTTSTRCGNPAPRSVRPTAGKPLRNEESGGIRDPRHAGAHRRRSGRDFRAARKDRGQCGADALARRDFDQDSAGARGPRGARLPEHR